ncbi:MAG: class I SAM-dependent methyltransferase [Gemmataceae bacterium]|nr:class I SAM-dependent methyltransferase [Gemmataceae bacterium]
MKSLFKLAALGCLIMLPLLAGAQQKDNSQKPKYANLTFVPTADEVIDKMFEMGKITKNDVMFDLGCGDNRICFKAAKKFGCKGVGLDINPVRIREAMDWAEKMNVGLLVETRHGDALNVKDISDATVVVMYMFPEFMNLWEPVAKAKLKPGTRILSHDYSFSNWEPDQTVIVRSSTREHKVHMWTVKKK